MGAERAERRDADRHIGQEMPKHPPVREGVERVGIAIAVAGGRDLHLRRFPAERHGEAARPPAANRRRPAVSNGVGPDVEVPGADRPVSGQRRFDLHQHRRTVGFVAMFLLAHPLDADRLAGQSARDSPPHRPRHHRRRYGRSSRSPGHGSHGHCRAARPASRRSPCDRERTPWVCDHTVSVLPSITATAQDGPIEPCIT